MPADQVTAALGGDDLQGTYHRLLAAATGGAGGRLAQARPPRRLHTWVGRPGFLRQADGAGWALVGDAGSFLDPLSTHGITDALRDAAFLTRSIIQTSPVGDLDPALGRFTETRNQVVEPLFQVADRIARFQWDSAELRSHLLKLSSAMSTEAELIATLDESAAQPSSR